jgi:hypothetical protein
MPTLPDPRPPEDPIDEIAYLIKLGSPWMSPVAARNRAVILQNSLKAEPMIFPACEQ